jgi:hypothetical protein
MVSHDINIMRALLNNVDLWLYETEPDFRNQHHEVDIDALINNMKLICLFCQTI